MYNYYTVHSNTHYIIIHIFAWACDLGVMGEKINHPNSTFFLITGNGGALCLQHKIKRTIQSSTVHESATHPLLSCTWSPACVCGNWGERMGGRWGGTPGGCRPCLCISLCGWPLLESSASNQESQFYCLKQYFHGILK